MFKVAEKCTSIRAAKARLNREEDCYERSKEKNDKIGMDRAKRKMENTAKYIALITEWKTAENIAIGPAMRIANITNAKKRETIMAQVRQVQETGISPLTGKPVGMSGITRPVIEYLIAKYDHKQYIPCKWIRLTPDRVQIIKSLLRKCGDDDQATSFLQSLMATA